MHRKFNALTMKNRKTFFFCEMFMFLFHSPFSSNKKKIFLPSLIFCDLLMIFHFFLSHVDAAQFITWSIYSFFFPFSIGKVASIESISPNLTVNEDKRKARIICRVNGEPFPKVTWFFNGRSINRNRTKFEFVHSR